ncbi:serine hydrolase [Candidatus Uabimicrobium amorphum]|nr:serine hydrolase [Candidatus Uabimicrobium amorphum]
MRNIILLFVFFIAICQAQNANLSGKWNGHIEIPGTQLKIHAKFHLDGEKWQGKMDIPQQGVKGLPLYEINTQGNKVTFVITGSSGNASFQGEKSKDTLVGYFVQQGQKFTFYLKLESKEVQEAKSQKLKKALKNIDAYITEKMPLWNVPGLALAVVTEDGVLVTKGYGYRHMAKKLPVTKNTLFAIGSTSKAFTTMSIGILVDKGKLNWDVPVQTYVPTFAVKDEYVSKHMTLRDLVTHRSGLPRHDLMWYGSSVSRVELFQRLRYLEPTKPFRTTWQYQNHMYMAAGYIAGQVANSTWENIVHNEIFAPLGMNNSNFSVDVSQKAADFATPYHIHDEKLEEIPLRQIDNIGPAGSINSNAQDMAKWLQLHINHGEFNGKRIISQKGLQDMHTAHMTMQGYSKDDKIAIGYGLGWFIDVYRGEYLSQHGGSIDGFRAQVTVLPKKGFAMAILTNSNNVFANLASLHITDVLLDKKPVDRHSKLWAQIQAAKKMIKPAEKVNFVQGTSPSHKLKDYVGTYENPGYGELVVEMKDHKLHLTYNNISTSLGHGHYDTFFTESQTAWEGVKPLWTFVTSATGEIASVSALLQVGVAEIKFIKKVNNKSPEGKSEKR